MSRLELQKKLRRKKFIRNIVIGVISLLVISFILDIAPGYMRDRHRYEVNLVVDGRNVTGSLEHEVYIDESGTIFLAMNDIERLIGLDIYDDTSEEVLSGVKKRLENKIDIIYFPISEMGHVFNIEVRYFEERGIVSVERLYRELTTYVLSSDTSLRFRARRLSREVATIEKGQTVRFFGREIGNWRQVQIEDGQVRIY